MIAVIVQGKAAEVRCAQCERRYVVTRTPCLVCTNDGVHRVVLFRDAPPHTSVTGLLCNTCLTELSGDEAIAGWRASPQAVPAEDPGPSADDIHPAAPL